MDPTVAYDRHSRTLVGVISDHVGWTTVSEPEEALGLPPGEKLFDVRGAHVSSTATCDECERPLMDHARYELRRPDGTGFARFP